MSNMPATITISPHPILPKVNRRTLTAVPDANETIKKLIHRVSPDMSNKPILVEVNGRVISNDDLHHQVVKSQDIIVVRGAVEGGDDSDPVRTILTIALLVYAPQIGAQFGAWAQAAFSIGGMYLIDQIAPIREPDLLEAQGSQSSPTYSISGSRNRARPNQPMPLVFGVHRIWPDLGAQAYTEFRGDEQYLYQLFHLGLSDLITDDYRIGDTPLSDFSDVELQVSGPDGRLDAFPGNVDSLAVGAALTTAAGWITRTSSMDCHYFSIDLVGSLFRVGGDSSIKPRTVQIDAEYRAVGDLTWLPFLPVGIVDYHTHYWSAGYWYHYTYSRETGRNGNTQHYTVTEWRQLEYDNDLSPTAHIDSDPYTGHSGGIWRWRSYAEAEADDDARPLRSYRIAEGGVIIENDSTKPVRRSYKTPWLPLGQYEIRVRRNTPDETNTRNTSNFSWSVLRSYQPDTADYSGQRRALLIIRASAQLSGMVDEFNCMARSLIPVRDDNGAWENNFSSNPAWQILAIARGKRTPQGRRLWGGGLTDSQIDVESIYAFADFCYSNDLRCDVVFDRAMSTARMMSVPAQCGRGAISWSSGKLGVIWDAPNQPAVHSFGMSNIKAGTFKVDYIAEDLPDRIEATFVDVENDYQQRTIMVNVPGVIEPRNPHKIDVMGVTRASQVAKEANLLAAGIYYRRRRVLWETDMEGLVVDRGDVVELSHDMTQWGYSGRLLSAGTTNLTLDQDVPFTSGSNHWLMLMAPDGEMITRQVNNQAGNASAIVLSSALPFDPSADVKNAVEDYLWIFAPRETPGKRVKITDIEPLSDNHVRVTATDEYAEYYSSETEGYYADPVPSYISRTPKITGIAVTEQLLLRAGQTEITLTFDLENADGIRLRLGINGSDPVDKGAVTGSRFTFNTQSGDIIRIEARPWLQVALKRFHEQPIFIHEHTVLGKLRPPNDVTQLLITVSGFNLLMKWQTVADIDVIHYELRIGDVWETAELLAEVDGSSYVYKYLPIGSTKFWISAVDDSGLYSENPLFSQITITAPAAPSISSQVVDNFVLLRYGSIAGTLPIERYEIRKGADYVSAEVVANVNGSFATLFETIGAQYIYWLVAIDAAGNYGEPKSHSVFVNEPPDYVLNVDWLSDFSGTQINSKQDGDTLLMLVDTSATYQQHFTNKAWARPQDQVTAGYPLWLIPGTLSANYEQIFDYGTLLSGTMVTFILASTTLAGTATVSWVLSVSVDGVSWINYNDINQVFATNFRYVKISLTASSVNDQSLLRIDSLRIRLDSKQITDAGFSSANATDAGGTLVNFNKGFIDITAIVVTPSGIADVRAVYDFIDAPNPTDFKVLLFDANGSRVSGDFSWTARGY